MRIEISKEEPSFIIVTLNGNLGAESVSQLENLLAGLVQAGNNAIAIAMNNVPYICSAGLRVLLSTQRQLQSTNGKFCLIGITKQVGDVLDVTGLRTVLKIYNSIDEARASL